jgi:hypothetical protein
MTTPGTQPSASAKALLALGITLGTTVGLTVVWPSHPMEPALAQAEKPPVSAPAELAVSLSPADRRTLEALAAQSQQQRWADLPFGQVMQTLASQLEGSVYREGLLDRASQETLVLSLQEFDCVLFVETVLGLAHTLRAAEATPASFSQQIQQMRYRNGQVNYCDRLHYFSDWIATNESQGLVKNITPDLGGIPSGTKLNFMSQHRKSYPQMRSQPVFQCIQQREASLANLPIHYLPHRNIRAAYRNIQAGDIVAIATAVPGLDVTHTGLAYRNGDGSIGLIHASPSGTVRIARDLASYVANVDEAIGIIVARPLPARS